MRSATLRRACHQILVWKRSFSLRTPAIPCRTRGVRARTLPIHLLQKDVLHEEQGDVGEDARGNGCGDPACNYVTEQSQIQVSAPRANPIPITEPTATCDCETGTRGKDGRPRAWSHDSRLSEANRKSTIAVDATTMKADTGESL